VTSSAADVSDLITSSARWPSRGRSVGLVAFLFGLLKKETVAGPVLRRLLTDLGMSEDGSRALLSRMVRQGQLASERQGRSTRYRLAGAFAHAFERVRDQPQVRHTTWTGNFHALLYHVPEAHRDYRDALRRAAIFAGYGLLQQGVLIAPTDRRAELVATLRDRPPGTQIWLTELGMDLDQAARAASIAWSLPALAALYATHRDRLDSQRAERASGPEALRTFVDLLLPALTDTLREPTLPLELLPADWPGTSLRRAMDAFQATYGPVAEQYVADLLTVGT
jgi:DNA-binding transcriptional regulator PaaX